MRLASLEPGTDCPDLGHSPVRDNDRDDATPDTEEPNNPTSAKSAFWSGTALGGDELHAALWGADPRFLLVAGSENAGKTSLIVGMWVEIANGHAAQSGWRFAGSRSLRGWTQLADHAFSWRDTLPRIVPRTSVADVRQPSFLHLDLSRDWGESLTQVLLSDLPGEWFEKWIVRREAGVAYVPMLERVDGVLLVVDAPRVLEDAQYLDDCCLLRDRVREAPGNVRRPIAIVLSKADCVGIEPGEYDPDQVLAMPPKLLKRVNALLQGFAPDDRARVFATSIVASGGLAPSHALTPLIWLLNETAGNTAVEPPRAPRRRGDHPFTWMRDREVKETP